MCLECEWEEGIEKADDVLSLLEEIPESKFSENVKEKTENIRAWISEHEHVTSKQITALDNMREGVDKWLDE